jgi:hypothetical protein
VPGFTSANVPPWPTLETLEWGRKWNQTRGTGLMLGAHMMGHDLNQPRGPITSLKEEPLGRWQLQQPDQTKLVNYEV